MSLPLEIDCDEVLLRSLRQVDINRSSMQIKPGALKPGKTDRRSLSLIREAIGVREARTAAIEHVHREGSFWGFGSADARVLGDHCADLRDDRATFHGHAEMILGFDIPAGPPNTPPDMTEVYAEAITRLIAMAKVFSVAQDAGEPEREPEAEDVGDR